VIITMTEKSKKSNKIPKNKAHKDPQKLAKNPRKALQKPRENMQKILVNLLKILKSSQKKSFYIN
jgi:hypothetical protein